MNNKVITTQGNVQFQFPDGKIVNVHPNHIYTVFNEDTVSFILVALPKSSGLSTMTSKAEDLELNGTVYSFAELPNAVSEAFAIAGAQARCEIVDELPETGYTNTIYLVPQPAPQTGFDEYVYILDQGWELIGDTSIEMDNYVLKTVFSGYTADTAVVLNGLRTDVDTTSGNVITETERALLAESGLSDAIDAEEAAREAADGVISGAVDTVSSGLAQEVERAQNAESGLSDAIDVVSGNVETETSRAEGVENAISGALDTHIQDEVRHITATERTSWNEKTKTISLTQSEYDALPSSAKTDATKLYVISDAQPIDLSVYAKVSALTEEISARSAADTALDNKIDAVSAATDDALALKQDVLEAGENIIISGNVISAEGGGTVETAITSGSTNAVESKAIWSATTYNKDVLLTFNGYNSTNYPQGCTKIKVEDITSHSNNNIIFNDNGVYVGIITINNLDSISVENYFDGATYEIDGTTVIISYPTITNITSINVSSTGNYVFKAVVEGAWIADSTYMKSEVDAIQNTLQNNINGKLDATAYTPTVVDSSLNIASTNPVQNQALYSELRIGNGDETETTIEWSGHDSTNYPSGCTKIKVEVVGNNNGSNIGFFGDWALGAIMINNWGSISVDASGFQGATYEISGTTVIISYPTVTNVTRIQVSAYSSNYTYKAVTTGAPTALKDQVVANTTALVEKVDTSDFNTYSAATDSRLSEDEEVTAAAFNELNEALSGKQNTLSAGRGISISSNTISFDLPIFAGTGNNSIIENYNGNVASGEYSHAEGATTRASGYYSHAEGFFTSASGNYSHAEGEDTVASGNYSHAEGDETTASEYSSHAEGFSTSASGISSHAEGASTNANGNCSHTEGYRTIANNQSEHASGRYNVSNKANTSFGDSGNTLFSVGNGTAENARHNVFEIRQNGDIYFEYDGNDIKLQDKLDDIESVTAAAINNLNDKFGGLKLQQITQSAYDQLQTKDPSTLYVIVN